MVPEHGKKEKNGMAPGRSKTRESTPGGQALFGDLSRILLLLIIAILIPLSSIFISSCSRESTETKPSGDASAKGGEKSPKELKEASIKKQDSPQKKAAASGTTNAKDTGIKIKALEITASSESFGKTKIIFNKDYAFVDNGVVQSIHKPPHDKVYFLSKESGTCLIWGTDTPYPFSNLFNYDRLLLSRTIKPAGKTRLNGYECQILEGFMRQEFPVMRYTLTSKIEAPPSLVKSYAINFFYDAKYGYPLKVEYRKQLTKSSDWGLALETLRLRETEVDMSLFKVPPYKVVKGVTEFTLFTPGSNDIEDLFEYHFDKKKKK